jgi:copper oxidase (laccase) domain-containing protein
MSDKMLSIFTSIRADGSMKSIHSGDIEAVNSARAAFLKKHDISPDDTTLVRMTYDRNDFLRYSTVNDESKGDGITKDSTIISDGLIVTQPNHALFLPLADCIGVVLHDPTKDIMMVSHLGRHNLEQFGGTKSVTYLARNHHVNPEDLTVWLSPAAGSDAYPLFAFDNRSLHDVAIEQLVNGGILAKNITTSPIDVTNDGNYYSHSKFLKGAQTDDGRFAIAAVMR